MRKVIYEKIGTVFMPAYEYRVEERASDKLFRLDCRHLSVRKDCNGMVMVCYENCEVKDVYFLKGVVGRGSNFEAACEDYMEQISGQTLVFDSMTNYRKEVTIL